MSNNKSESAGSAIKNRIAAYENLAKNNKSKTGKLLRVEPPKPGYSGTKAHRDLTSNVRGREKYNIQGPIKTKPQPEKTFPRSPSKQQPVNHRSEQRDDFTKRNDGLVDTMLTIGRDDDDHEIPAERSISPLSYDDFGLEVRRDDRNERRNLALNALQSGGDSNPKEEVLYSLFSPEISNTNQPEKKKTDNDFSLFKVSGKNEVKKEDTKKVDIKKEDPKKVDINNQFSESKSKSSYSNTNKIETNKNIDQRKQPNPEYKQKRIFFGRNHEKNVEAPSQQKSEVAKLEQREQEIGSVNKPVFTEKSVENPMQYSIPSVDLSTFNDIDHFLQPSKDDNYTSIPRVQGSTIEAMNQSQSVEYYYNDDSFSSSSSSDSISKLTKSTVGEVVDEKVNALMRRISDECYSQHNDDDSDSPQNIDDGEDCDDRVEVVDDRIQDVRVDDTLADEINNDNVHVVKVEGNSFDEVDKDEVVQNQVLYTNDPEDEDVQYEDIENDDVCSGNEDVKHYAICDVDVEHEGTKDQQSDEDRVECEQDLEEEEDHDDDHEDDYDDDESIEDQHNRNEKEAAILSTNQGDNKDHDIVQRLATSSLESDNNNTLTESIYSETSPIGVNINMSLSTDSEPDMVGRYNIPSGSIKDEQLSHGIQLSRSSNVRQSRDSSFMSQHRYDSHGDKYNLNLLKSRTNEFDMFTPQNNTSNNNYRIFGENELVVEDAEVSVLTEDSFGEGLKVHRNSNNQSLDKISYRNDESVTYTDQASNSTKNATSRSTRVFRDASPLRSDNIMVRRNSSGLSEITGDTSSLKRVIAVKRVNSPSIPNNKPNLPTISNYDGKIKKKRSFLRSLSPFRRQSSDAESDNTKAFDNRNRRDKNDKSTLSQSSLNPRGRSRSVGSRQSLGSGNGEDEDSRSPFLGIEMDNTPDVLERPNMVKAKSSGRFFGLFRKR